MEKIQFADELVREFLVFRGFTSTLQAFEKELATDIGQGFQLDKILDLIFSIYVPKFDAHKLVDLLDFFRDCFSYSDSTLIPVISKLNQSILRYYIVNALKSGRKDKVLDFFGVYGNDLLQRDDEWSSWFGESRILLRFRGRRMWIDFPQFVSRSDSLLAESAFGSTVSCVFFRGVVPCSTPLS